MSVKPELEGIRGYQILSWSQGVILQTLPLQWPRPSLHQWCSFLPWLEVLQRPLGRSLEMQDRAGRGKGCLGRHFKAGQVPLGGIFKRSVSCRQCTGSKPAASRGKRSLTEASSTGTTQPHPASSPFALLLEIELRLTVCTLGWATGELSLSSSSISRDSQEAPLVCLSVLSFCLCVLSLHHCCLCYSQCSFGSRVFLPYHIIHSRLCSLSVVIIQPSPSGIQIPHTLL